MAVFTVDETNPALGLTQLSYPNYEDFRDQNEVFDGTIAWGFPFPASMLEGEEPEQVFTETVTENYFEVLGVEPELGRFILPEEDRAEGANPVAVVSYKLWTRRFGQDAAILNRRLILNGTSFDVIGVAPQGFQGVNALFSPDLWVPMMMYRQVLPEQFPPVVSKIGARFSSTWGGVFEPASRRRKRLHI